jgi:hypothetical protein
LKREVRESNLVSEKIDPLKVLLLLFSFFVCPSIGVANFFCTFWGTREENEFAFFSQKSVKKDREKREEQKRDKMMKRERTEEEEKKREFVRLMCVSLFSFEEECRYTTNNK